jgi:hypothetical protein
MQSYAANILVAGEAGGGMSAMDSLKAQVARQREAIIVLQDQLQVLHQRIRLSARARALNLILNLLSVCLSARLPEKKLKNKSPHA